MPVPAPAAAPATDEKKPVMQEELVVTGSRVRRKDLTTAAPVTVLTREQWQQSGKVTIGDFLQSLPEQGNAPNFQLNNGGANYNADGATRISLRSLGVTRTLVLVNGRRMVNSGVGASSSVDLNTVPAAAVDHIDVLKDGASALYGSDAIAGVVNIVTRRNFNGTEANATYGLSGHGDAQTFDANVTTGRASELGSFIFSAGYFNQKESWLRDRDFSAHALTYDYHDGTTSPGGSSRVPQGAIALPTDDKGNETAGCKANSLCHALVTGDPTWQNDLFIRDPSTALGWRPFAGADKYNFAAENYLTIPATRVSAYSAGDTHVGPVRGYYEAEYVLHSSAQNAAPMPLAMSDYGLTFSADSMYNPFNQPGLPGGVELADARRRLVEFGHRTYAEDLNTFHIVTGVDGELPDQFGPLHGWYWDANMNYGRTSGTFTTGGAIRNSRVADAVGPSMADPKTGTPTCVRVPGDISTAIAGCVPLNMFGGANNGSIDPSQIQGLGYDGISRSFDALFAVDLNTTGELFRIAADRPVSLALGYEFRRQSGAQIADPVAAAGDSADNNFKSTNGYFTVNEAFAELSVPLLANIEFVKELEADLAARYVDYSTFGSNTSFKVGARYSPVQDLTIRGTYSTAFRAPTISELYLGQSEAGPVATDPCNFTPGADPALIAQCEANGVKPTGSGDVDTQQLAKEGGNPNLKPETAQTLTAGVVLQPRQVKGLSVTVDYYALSVDNLISNVGAAAILAGCFTGSAAASNPTYCSYVHRSASGRIAFIDDINQNVGKLETAGIDFAVRYALPTEIGRFNFAFDANWLQYFDRTQSVGATTLTIHGKGTYDLGALPALKAIVGVNYNRGGFNVGGLLHYVGNFKECGAFDSDSQHYLSAGGLCYADPAAPARQVGHNTWLDLHVSYALASQVGKTMFMVGVNNVFDQAPQFVYASALANSDPSTYDYLGRYVYGRVQHTF